MERSRGQYASCCILYTFPEAIMKKLLFILLTSLLVAVQNIAETPNAAQLSQKKLIKARPLPINDVRLLGGPLKKAQDLDAQYLLELEPNRMLVFLVCGAQNFCRTARCLPLYREPDCARC